MIGRRFYEKNGLILINKEIDADGEIIFEKKLFKIGKILNSKSYKYL